jgi:hypothetical protein
MPAQKKSMKNTPTEADQKDHHIEEDNGNSLVAQPSQISDQERQAKLEALQRHEQRKLHILWRHLLKKKSKRKMMRLWIDN